MQKDVYPYGRRTEEFLKEKDKWGKRWIWEVWQMKCPKEQRKKKASAK